MKTGPLQLSATPAPGAIAKAAEDAAATHAQPDRHGRLARHRLTRTLEDGTA